MTNLLIFKVFRKKGCSCSYNHKQPQSKQNFFLIRTKHFYFILLGDIYIWRFLLDVGKVCTIRTPLATNRRRHQERPYWQSAVYFVSLRTHLNNVLQWLEEEISFADQLDQHDLQDQIFYEDASTVRFRPQNQIILMSSPKYKIFFWKVWKLTLEEALELSSSCATNFKRIVSAFFIILKNNSKTNFIL